MDRTTKISHRSAEVPPEFIAKWQALTEKVRLLEVQNANLQAERHHSFTSIKPETKRAPEGDLIEFLRSRISTIADHNTEAMDFIVQGRPNLALKELQAAENKFDEIRKCRRR